MTIRSKDCREEPVRSSMNVVKSQMETGRTEENYILFTKIDFFVRGRKKVSRTELRNIITMQTLSVVLKSKKLEICDNTFTILS
jgi:hypothetical protein